MNGVSMAALQRLLPVALQSVLALHGAKESLGLTTAAGRGDVLRGPAVAVLPETIHAASMAASIPLELAVTTRCSHSRRGLGCWKAAAPRVQLRSWHRGDGCENCSRKQRLRRCLAVISGGLKLCSSSPVAIRGGRHSLRLP